MRLDKFANSGFDRGASRFKEILWICCQGICFGSWLPGSKWRCMMLRAFGAKVGHGVVIKPHVKVKFPWRLSIGNYSWIGEGVWIDNLAAVTIEEHVCVSQGVYVCTGNHDWTDPAFGLITQPVIIQSGAWIGAQSTVCPGCVVESGAVLPVRSIAAGTYAGNLVHLRDGSTKPRRS